MHRFFRKNWLIQFHISSTRAIRPVKWNKLSFSSIEITKPLSATVQFFVGHTQVQKPTLVVGCLIILRVESSIISIDSHWGIVGKCSTRSGALRNSSINWIFLLRLPIQNHLKLHITKKRQNKAKKLIRNSTSLMLVKRTSIPNPVEIFTYTTCCSLRNTRLTKSPSNFNRYNCQKICCTSRGPKELIWGPYWKSDKKATFLRVIKKPASKLSKHFTNHRKETKKEVVFSNRPFSNIHE